MRALLAFLATLPFAASMLADEPARTDALGDRLPALATHRLGTTRWRQQWSWGTLTWSVDGKVLAAGRTEEGAGLWDVAAARLLKEWKAARHFSLYRATILSADGKVLASVGGDQDCTIQAFEVDTGKERKTWTSPERVYGLALSPDGKHLATIGWKQDVRLWDTVQWTEAKLFQHGGRSAVFGSDGQTLLIGSDKRVRVWDLATGKETRRLEGAARHLAISADGKTLVGAGEDRLHVWDLATGRQRQTIEARPGRDSLLAVSGDGRTVAFANDSALRAWDTGSGKERFQRAGALWGGSVALSADGRTLVWSGGGKVERHDLATGRDLAPCPGHLSSVYSLAFSPDGRRLLSRSADDIVLVWKLGAAQPEPALTLPCKGESYIIGWRALWSTDGKLVAAPAWPDKVRLLDAATGKEVRTLSGGGHVCGPLAFSPDGKLLATCDDHYPGGSPRPHGRIHFWEASSGKLLRTIEGHGSHIQCIAFAPDGKALASSCQEGVRLWDVADGKQLRRMTVEDRFAVVLRFSPDGQTLFAGGAGVAVCNVATGERLRHLSGKERLADLALSSDGKLLAVASGSTIQVWDPAAGTEVTRFTGHSGAVTALAFSPDDKVLASGGNDTTILLWDVIGGLIAARTKVKPVLPPADLDALWTNLAGADATAGHKAVWTLAGEPHRSVTFLKDRLQAPEDGRDELVVPAGDLLRFIRAVEALERIGTVEARAVLEKLAGGTASRSSREAAAALRRLDLLKSRAAGPSKEPGRNERLEQLWKDLGEAEAAAGHSAAWALAADPEQAVALCKARLKPAAQAEDMNTILVPAGDPLRTYRAVAVLERIGTAEARNVLEALAQGAPSRITAEARAALKRLHRTKGKP